MNMNLLKFKAAFDYGEGVCIFDVSEIGFEPNRVYMENGGFFDFDGCNLMMFIGQWDVEGNEIYTGMIIQSPCGDSYIVHQAEDGAFVLEEICYGHRTPVNELCLFEFKISGTIFESIE